MLTLESTTIERLTATITTTNDPTGTPPDFAVTPAGQTDPAGWQPGAWFGTWNTTTGNIEAVTPTIGTTPATLTLTEGVTYQLWVRWTAGTDTPVRSLGTIYTT